VRVNKKAQQRVFSRRRLLALSAVGLVLLLAIIAALLDGPSGQDRGSVELTVRAPELARERAKQRATKQAERLRRAFNLTLRRAPAIRRGPVGERQIALTFDDGPGIHTAPILDVLDRFRAPATFFVVGGVNDGHAALIKRAVSAGHAIENHTVSHADMATLPRREQAREIDVQTKAIVAMGAPRPRFFRPPYNSRNAETLRLLRKRKMLMALWSVDPDDWARPGTKTIVQRVLDNVHAGGIILLHDGGGNRAQTSAALPAIIRGLRKRGYRLVTLPELLLPG
jgi:peptidoglycan/xylan/chitin deacetylase (PgdA/CDA1 family)